MRGRAELGYGLHHGVQPRGLGVLLHCRQSERTCALESLREPAPACRAIHAIAQASKGHWTLCLQLECGVTVERLPHMVLDDVHGLLHHVEGLRLPRYIPALPTILREWSLRSAVPNAHWAVCRGPRLALPDRLQKTEVTPGRCATRAS